MKYKAALFDLDGVLIDTEPIYTLIWSNIESRFPTGIPDFALSIKGNTLPRILGENFKPEDHDEIKRLLVEAEEKMEYPLYPDTVRFLKSLAEAGVPAAIVTSSGDAKMERLFAMHAGLRELFGAVITDSWVSKGKPDPECYMIGARELGAKPEECVVFEDSYNGLKAGRAAGSYVVALSTTNPAEKLADLSDMVAGSLSEIDIDSLF